MAGLIAARAASAQAQVPAELIAYPELILTNGKGKVGAKLRGASVAEMLEQVRALVREAAPGSPLYVRMADEFVNDLAKLTGKDADALAPSNPLMLSFERFVTRSAGFMPRRAQRVWAKEQAVDRKQALRMVTISAARFISEDDKLGSLEKRLRRPVGAGGG